MIERLVYVGELHKLPKFSRFYNRNKKHC